jgi:hypothetical protein
LYERQLLFDSAVRDYERAQALDSQTPLPRLSEAALLYRAGHLERARALVEWVLAEDDPTWLYNYGTDLDRFRLDLYTSAANIYHASARQARLAPRLIAGTAVAGWWRSLRYRVTAWYYRGLSRRFAARVAASYRRQGRDLNAYWTYLTAFDEMSGLADRYLERSRRLETRLVPESRLDYEVLQAMNGSDPNALLLVADKLDSSWYADQRAQVLVELMKRGKTSTETARELFYLNRGVFLRSGLPVPVEYTENVPNRLIRALRRRGLREAEHAAVVIDVTEESVEPVVRWSVIDPKSGTLVRSGGTEPATTAEDAPSGDAEKNRMEIAADRIAAVVTRHPLSFGSETPDRQ